MENRDRVKLICEISEVSFYLDELRLFLDTHPSNEEALAMYNEHAIKRKCLVDEYVECFGPLSYYDVNVGNRWKWVEYPWPCVNGG